MSAPHGYEPVAIQIVISATDAAGGFTTLHDVAQTSDTQLTVGATRQLEPEAGLYFDPAVVHTTLQAVSAVITGIGGALKVVDWIQSHRANSAHDIVVRVGTTTVTVTADNQEDARAALEAALGLV